MVLRWQCNDRGCYKDKCIPDWGFLDDTWKEATGRNIRITDIDGTVEINSHFLFLEWKGSKVPLSLGQQIYYERLSKLSSNITILLIYGNDQSVDAIQTIENGKLSSKQPSSKEQLVSFCSEWANKSNKEK